MNFYIRELLDGSATLMTDNGVVLWTFCSVEDARQACREWYAMNEPVATLQKQNMFIEDAA